MKRKQNFKPLILQFAWYGGVGIIGTGVHYTIFLVAVQFNILAPVPASTTGYLFGAITNYYCNYYITFKSNSTHVKTMLKFFIVALFGLVINYMIFYMSYTYYGFHHLLSQIFATGVVFVLTFCINKLWTYNRGAENEGN